MRRASNRREAYQRVTTRMSTYSQSGAFRFYKNLCPVPQSDAMAHRVDGFLGWQEVLPNWQSYAPDVRQKVAFRMIGNLVRSIVPGAKIEVMPFIKWTNPGRVDQNIHPGLPYLKIYFYDLQEFTIFRARCDTIWERKLKIR